jgi:hypothetical protein
MSSSHKQTTQIEAPFGRLITAMVTPFLNDGSIDWDGVAKISQLTAQLVKRQRLRPLKSWKSFALLKVR